MRNVNKNDCTKNLRVVLLYGEFYNVPEFSRLYTFSMLLAEQQPVGLWVELKQEPVSPSSD